jgi:hypothetical protein
LYDDCEYFSRSVVDVTLQHNLNRNSAYLPFQSRRTVCVTRKWAGVDSAWEQEKLEARKMLVNRAESHTSGARFVGQPACLPERWIKIRTTANLTEFYP